MIIALIDNGSLEPAATLNLRRTASMVSQRSGVAVHAVSWKHSDRLPALAFGGEPAWTLARWVHAQLARGEREFVFIPFFVSAQGAIGSALRNDLEKLGGVAGLAEAGPGSPTPATIASDHFHFTFTAGLADQGIIPAIVAARVREAIVARGLKTPRVVVVDHGGPSIDSAKLRDAIAADVRKLLGAEIGDLAAASMEGVHGPLLADQLAAHDFSSGEIVVAPLFLSPGRHAGPAGDVAQICRAAESLSPSRRCFITGLVGTHSDAIEPLSDALRATLEIFYAKTFA